MAKVQSFADKLKKKQKEEAGITVKIIRGVPSKRNNDSIMFAESYVKIKDMSEIDKIK